MKSMVRSEWLGRAKPQSCEIGLIRSNSVADQMFAEHSGYGRRYKRQTMLKSEAKNAKR